MTSDVADLMRHTSVKTLEFERADLSHTILRGAFVAFAERKPVSIDSLTRLVKQKSKKNQKIKKKKIQKIKKSK